MRTVAAITLLISLLAACGQTGPLYLPGEAPQQETAEDQSADNEAILPGT